MQLHLPFSCYTSLAGRRGSRCAFQSHVSTAPKRDICSRVSAPETASPIPAEALADAASDASGNARQMYIQESVNFTGSELAARLPSMQAALRAQRAESSNSSNGSTTSATSSSHGSGNANSRPASNSTPEEYYARMAEAEAKGVTPDQAANRYANISSSTNTNNGRNGASSYEPPNGNGADNGTTSHTSSSHSSSNSYSTSYPPLPNLQGLSASQKLQALQQAQQMSKQALQHCSPYYVNAPKTIDVRMYDQMVVAHNKMSKKLAEANAHIAFQDEEINTCNEDLIAAYELLKQIAMEFGTTCRLAQGTAAAVQFGVDPQDALDKIGKLQDRLSTLEQAVLEQRQEFGLRVVRCVPVEWIGVANEVKVMGDFDGWTRGHELSAEDVTSDSVYSRWVPGGVGITSHGVLKVPCASFMPDNMFQVHGMV
eukprot:GHRR01008598.1.p1 GENE.GHRR01008598.1~~GHRR01008598.1.p1  ORF type:complete len:428 (+),score=162.07 GHRR01008598.1:363-1646(+)